MKTPELLAPAGNFEKLKTALHYGADAVYMGLSEFSLRAKADNFSRNELEYAVRRVQKSGRKIYITANIIPHNRDIALLKDHFIFLNNIRPDAIIVSDPGAFEMARDAAPDIPLHVSTQANISNYRSAKFWEKCGAQRIVLSRELSVDEIREIRDHVSLQLECFVHGAICISYSGRCYISSYLTHRSGNRGECTNSCRWNYVLMEEKREGTYLPVYENSRGTYVLSSRDLCMIEHLDKLADAGVDSFKIEGRMKGINYVAGVVKTYREAIESLGNRPYSVKEQWLEELSMFSSRGFTTGMYLGAHPEDGYNHYDATAYRMSHELVGVVKSVHNGKMIIALRNNLRTGDCIEFLSSGIQNRPYSVTDMRNERGTRIDAGHNEEIIILPSQSGVRENDLIRRRLNR